MLKIDDNLKKQLIVLKEDKDILLQGNILKIIDPENDEEFKKYLSECLIQDKESRKRRLEITKQVQDQNKELIRWKKDNERISQELKQEMVKSEKARIEAENAKNIAENDLDLLQKKKQTELMEKIVKMALYVIVSVGISTTLLYLFSIYTNKDTQMIGATWSNIFGILLTNAFSIIGTIMGVKYATEKKEG